MNATDPRFVMPLFRAALQAGAHYLDMAMSLSHPHPDEPYAKTGVKLGDDQFALAEQWEQAGKLALVGIGVEPGLSDVFARYAADTHVQRDRRDRRAGRRQPRRWPATTSRPPSPSGPRSRSASTRRSSGRRTGAGSPPPPFSEPEIFTFPAGIGPVECVNVEHEEVLLIPRWVAGAAGHVQVRPRRGVHRRAADPAQARPGLAPTRSGRRRQRVAARRGRGLPARPGHARRQDDRPDLRGHLGHRHRHRRRPARGLPAPRGRQRLVHGRVRLPGRGLADGGQPGRGAGADRLRRLVGRRRARPRGAARPAVPRPAHRLRLAVGVRGADAPQASTSPELHERRLVVDDLQQLHRRTVDRLGLRQARPS